MRHPNILTFLGVSVDESLNFYMITELAPKGSLIHMLQAGVKRAKRRIKGAETQISWETRLEICKQIVSGLTYLHSKQIFHRDLKAENILIFPAGDNERIMYTCKISDFGLSLLQEKHAIFKFAARSTSAGNRGSVASMKPSVGTWFIKAPVNLYYYFY